MPQQNTTLCKVQTTEMYFLTVWRLEVQGQHLAPFFPFEGSHLRLQMAAFSLHLHGHFSVRMYPWGLFFCPDLLF